MQTAQDSEQNGSDQSDCSTCMYSSDKYSTPARTVMAETTMIASAERMGFGNIYDKHKDAILSFLGHKYVLVLLPTEKR